MPKDGSGLDGERSQIGDLAKRYEGNPVIGGLLSLLPGWSLADGLLAYRARQLISERTQVFFDELAAGRIALTEEIVQSEEFLHCYFATARAALNSRRREKIRMFARLLTSAADDSMDFDEYEELLLTLDMATSRELGVLRLLRQYETNPADERLNALQKASIYWLEFETAACDEFRIPQREFNAFMSRIQRTGLYREFVGTFVGYTGNRGSTTPLFARLADIVVRLSDNPP